MISEDQIVVGCLKYAIVTIDRHNHMVRTTFRSSKLHCDAFRDLSDPININEALSQGYGGPGNYSRAVWRSLVEHEILHSFLSEHLFGRPSVVLSLEAGHGHPEPPAPLWERYEEEVLCLTFQYYLNRGLMHRPLELLNAARSWGKGVARLSLVWNHDIAPLLAPLWQQQG